MPPIDEQEFVELVRHALTPDQKKKVLEQFRRYGRPYSKGVAEIVKMAIDAGKIPEAILFLENYHPHSDTSETCPEIRTCRGNQLIDYYQSVMKRISNIKKK